MRKSILLFFTFGVLLASCSSEDSLLVGNQMSIDGDVSHSIGQAEALGIANKVLGSVNSTRGMDMGVLMSSMS